MAGGKPDIQKREGVEPRSYKDYWWSSDQKPGGPPGRGNRHVVFEPLVQRENECEGEELCR